MGETLRSRVSPVANSLLSRAGQWHSGSHSVVGREMSPEQLRAARGRVRQELRSALEIAEAVDPLTRNAILGAAKVSRIKSGKGPRHDAIDEMVDRQDSDRSAPVAGIGTSAAATNLAGVRAYERACAANGGSFFRHR